MKKSVDPALTGRPLAASCTAITKEFGQGNTRALVLRGVDLDIPFGEITMLVGPSGCGKTTLLTVIAGLARRTGGDLDVLGSDPQRLSPREQASFRRRNLGFVFQHYNLLPALSAAENAAVPLLAAGMKRSEALERSAAILERLGLGARLRNLPGKLSGGQQQRVAIARALVGEPRLVLCDEPTAALDHETGRTVMELIAEVCVRPDRAVVVVTHDTRVFQFAHRIAHMDDGAVERIVRPGPVVPDEQQVALGSGSVFLDRRTP